MKTRAKLLSIFQMFYVEVRTQFNTSIRILRSDNAKEYLSASFSSLMSSHGILHQFARTLLLHHKVPQRFWEDVILVACYLINRMSSSILHNQIPHSIIFPNQPLLCLPPRIFGWVCLVHIRTPRQDKLSAKATKCVFLGYS